MTDRAEISDNKTHSIFYNLNFKTKFMVRKILLSVVSAVAFCSLGLAQNRTVSGTVVNEQGTPIVGVVVSVPGTTASAVTDASGRYSISAPASGSLHFGLFGMQSQVNAIESRSIINVTMLPDTTSIDDVVVVAYGVTTREAFTGSASVLGEDAIEKRQVSNVTKALSGAVAGVQGYSDNGQPGSDADIRIRGVGSIFASNQPLYVLDGVPFEGEMSSINPQDIETMTVLKDASAAAIYGARGANGVILINTKRGSSREATISFDAKWGSNSRGVPRYEVMTDPDMYFETLYRAIHNSYLSNSSLSYTPAQMNVLTNSRLFHGDNGTGFQVYTIPQGQQFIGINGKVNPNATLGYSDGEHFYKPDDFYKESFGKKALRQEYNVSVSGADEKFNYYLSGGYLNDTGFIPNSNFERFTTRIKADYQAKKWLRFTTNISYTNTVMNNPDDQEGTSSANIFYMSNSIAPVYPFYVRDPEGNIMKDDRGMIIYEFGDGKTSNQTRKFLPGANPYAGVVLNYFRQKMDVFSGRWGVSADIVEGLRFKANLGVDLDSTDETRQDNKWYGQYEASGGYLYRWKIRQAAINQQYLLSYNKRWGQHNFDALAGYETYRLDIDDLFGSRENIYNPDNHELSNAISNHINGSTRDRYALTSFLARVQYDYAGKYFLSASYRRDGSSRFAADNRWGDFGSVGAAWIVSDEDFFNVGQFNMLKLKASWGTQGNDGLNYPNGYSNYYPYADQYTLEDSDGDYSTILTNKGNPEITWETSLNFNAGVEFDMFRGRFGGNIEVFNRKTIDLLYNKPAPTSGGYATIPMNIGTMRNTGIEIDLYGTIIQNQNFQWTVNANGTFLKNKILALAEAEIIDGSRRYAVGGSFFNMYLREFAGVAQEDGDQWQAGQALYWMVPTNDQGEELPRELTNDWAQGKQYDTGSVMPKFYGGFGTSLSFHNFDVSAQFAYQLGGRVYDSGYAGLMHGGRNNEGQNWHLDILDAWTPNHQSSDTPRINVNDTYTSAASTRFLIKSDYLSINNVTVGYTVPGKYTEKMGVGSLRIYFTADNLAVFSARKGLDPRQVLAGVTDDMTYSAIRSLSGGISVSF